MLEALNARLKLRTMLQSSAHYEVEVLLREVERHQLYEESAILYGATMTLLPYVAYGHVMLSCQHVPSVSPLRLFQFELPCTTRSLNTGLEP